MRYRVQQFWQALFAKPLTEEEWKEVKTVLKPAEQELFRRFPIHDQLHSFQVLNILIAAEYKDPALLPAALLHDIGKTKVRLTLIERVIVVLGERLLPKKVQLWGEGEVRGWQRPFVVKARHPQWGAEMAAEAGSDPLTVSLIRRHQDEVDEDDLSAETELLRALQWADNQA